MPKPKNNSPIARRNRQNRRRGSKFEKTVADFLDMDVVPYSGSNARFGYGDVRDSKWLVECKNITIDDKMRVCIKQDWIQDNLNRANAEQKSSALVWMPSGRSSKYALFDEETFRLLNVEYNQATIIPKVSYLAINLFIGVDDIWVKQLKPTFGVAQLSFGDTNYYMMNIELFKTIINTKGLKGTRQTYD